MELLRGSRRVALACPYKDCILEGGQTKEEEKRKEFFFNQVLAQDRDPPPGTTCVKIASSFSIRVNHAC
ncbi:MAG: hypothetical protein AB1453_03535 [Chloroflexota bacterium]